MDNKSRCGYDFQCEHCPIRLFVGGMEQCVNEKKTLKPINLSEAIKLFIHTKKAERFSNDTIACYNKAFKRALDFFGEDKPFGEIGVDDIRELIARMDDVGNRTVVIYHTGLASLWTWAIEEGYADDHIIRKVKRPRFQKPKIEPFDRYQIRALLKAAEDTRNPARNRAIILFLLDTGVRASELCSLKIGDLKGDHVTILGKGKKVRTVPVSTRTLKAYGEYLFDRRHTGPDEAMFASERWESDGHIGRNGLRKLLYRLGELAGVEKCHPHRLRHTFAIAYLRNGGDVYTLQEIMGHSTLDMVKEYLAISQVDTRVAHKKASPVENWHL